MTNIKPGDKCWAPAGSVWLEAQYVEKVTLYNERTYHRVHLLSGGHAIVSAVLPHDAFKPVDPK